jgi:uncharacterized protein YlxP (DUF503 family)
MSSKIGLIHLHIQLPGSDSLKAKRRRLRPLLTRLQKEFNVSAAEVDYQNLWQDALIACALVTDDEKHAQRSLQKLATWLEANWPDATLVDDQIEIIK